MGAVLNRVSGNYFDAAGIPIIAGRSITPSDTASTLKVAVVNQAFARHYFPHGGIIGRTVKIDISESGPWQIVGITRDTKSEDPRADAPRTVYMPLAQIAGLNGDGGQDSFAWVMVLRTSGDPAQIIAPLRAAVASVDPNLPILHVRTIQDQLETSMNHETLISRLTTIFAGLAVLLAAIGLYAVMSFSVVHRTAEIGIRIALGASSAGVQWMFLRESLILLATGLGLGLPIAVYAVRLVRSQLYQMSPFDPLTFMAATAGIAVAVVLSAWLPARRAAGVNPMTALRSE
jgi:predicted permease